MFRLLPVPVARRVEHRHTLLPSLPHIHRVHLRAGTTQICFNTPPLSLGTPMIVMGWASNDGVFIVLVVVLQDLLRPTSYRSSYLLLTSSICQIWYLLNVMVHLLTAYDFDYPCTL
jgi:hypothetical protein